ncbi:MAG: PHB depolymerase family esterase [Gemmatimonadota bacterium]|jgi:polyhydroxybutyrate depolymerase
MGGRRWVVGVMMVGALAACSAPESNPFDLDGIEGDGVLGSWVHSGFYDRSYLLHEPPDLDPTRRYPLLVLLHGAGGSGRSFHALLDPDSATDAAGFITVFPDGIGGTWTVGCGGCTAAERAGANDVTFLQTLVHQLVEGLPVDPARVYVAGFSQGAQLAQLFGCQSSEPPAGIASVAGLLYRDPASGCTPRGAFPVIFIHGDHDPVMRIAGFGAGANILSLDETVGVWLASMACDTPPEVSERPDSVGDGSWVTTIRYGGCAAGGPVVVERVNRGGHTWPGRTGPWPSSVGFHSRNLDATGTILALFSQEP